MRIALAQINPIVGDITGNVSKILQFAAKAKSKNADLVVFPELAITGYPPGDLLFRESFIEANLKALQQIKESLKDLPTILGFVDRNYGKGRPLHNACAFLVNGEIKAKQYKTLLPTYDVFDEDRYFQSAIEYKFAAIGSHKVGMTICEDAWSGMQLDLYGAYGQGLHSRYFVDPIQQVANLDVDLIVNIAASPFAVGKHKVRENLLCHHARKHQVPIVFVNQVGGNDELVFDGRSLVIDAQGKIIANCAAFNEDLQVIDLNEQDHSLKGVVKPDELSDIEDISQALILGTKDYVTKCGFKDVVLGISGGIDSALVSVIACKALGAEHVLGLCMPSPYSSPGSVNDSMQLAKNLGMQLVTVPISEAMKTFDNMFNLPFTGKEKDVTEENIQARLRGIVLMSFSNKFNRLLLSTGNKSELAVGYCTLYGDMCGGLAVISDLPKMRVYELAKFYNRQAGYDLIPQAILEKAPSAELSPGQKDSDCLPPYSVLDAVIQAYIEEGKTLAQIVESGYAPEVVAAIVRRIEHNEFKRRQAAPGLKLTPRAFGIGWRMPIAQRFSEEL